MLSPTSLLTIAATIFLVSIPFIWILFGGGLMAFLAVSTYIVALAAGELV